MTRVRERRLEHLVDEASRPVRPIPDQEYVEIGVRSHGRGVFLKPAVFGSDLGNKAVFEVHPQELVFNIVFAWEGAVALTGDEVIGCIASHRFPTYKAREDEVDLRYLKYFFQTPRGLFLLGDNSPGAAGRNRTLNRRRLLKECIPVPPLTTQRRLADHLDIAVASIDSLTESNRFLLDLAMEAAGVLVTTSPDPTIGARAQVPWVRTLPANWSVLRAKGLFREVHLPPEEDDGVVTAFRDGQVTLRELRRKDGYMVAVAEQGYQRVRKGDLVVHQMDGFAGAIGVSEATGKCSPEYIILEPRNRYTESEFYAECLRTMARNGYVQVICPSVRERAPRFLFSTLKDVELPVPSAREQADRVTRIKSLRKAIKRIRRQQMQLSTYRRSTIASAIESAIRGKASTNEERSVESTA